MPATLRYTALRFLMILVVGAICFVLGARGPLLVLLAFLISLPLSYVLLARFRGQLIDEFAEGKADKVNPARAVRALNDRIEASKVAEDAAVDANLGLADPDDHPGSDEQDGPARKV